MAGGFPSCEGLHVSNFAWNGMRYLPGSSICKTPDFYLSIETNWFTTPYNREAMFGYFIIFRCFSAKICSELSSEIYCRVK
jgi:hypothetical protein